MLKRIALPSALAVSLLALTATAVMSQPRGSQSPFSIFDWDPEPADDGPQEPDTPQKAPAQAEAKPAPVVKLQAPGASSYSAPSPNPELEPIASEIRSRMNSILSSARGGTHAEDSAALTAFYNGRGGLPIWTSRNGFTKRAALAMTEIRRADDWGLSASAFTLPEPDGAEPAPGDLAASDIKLSLAVLKYARHARGGRIDYSEAFDLVDERTNVYEPKSTLQAIAASDSPDEFLRDLHPKHEGFRKLREALRGLEATASAGPESDRPGKGRKGRSSPPDEERRRIIVNMERWRLLPDDLGEFYVWNNVAEQFTRVYDRGRLVLKERIIVGKPKTPTPMFSAKMQRLVFHPEWGVPDSIKLNEILPKLREYGRGGGSQVLGRLNLRITLDGREINPDSVDWNSVDIRRYQFVQPSGERNALGLVKFLFPNKHDVYMHDTPDKKLFANATRTYSHGCMRTQNPFHLAEVVLAHDRNFSPDDVRQLQADDSGKPKEIKLNTPIPVHVVYFTMPVDDDGRLHSVPDVYGADKMITAALNGEPLRFSLKAQGQAMADVEAPRDTGSRRGEGRDSRYRDQRDQGGDRGDPYSRDPRDRGDPYSRDSRDRGDPYSRDSRDRGDPYSRDSRDRGDPYSRDPRDRGDQYSRDSRDRGGPDSRDPWPFSDRPSRRPPPDSEDTWSSGRWNRLDGIFGR